MFTFDFLFLFLVQWKYQEVMVMCYYFYGTGCVEHDLHIYFLIIKQEQKILIVLLSTYILCLYFIPDFHF